MYAVSFCVCVSVYMCVCVGVSDVASMSLHAAWPLPTPALASNVLKWRINNTESFTRNETANRQTTKHICTFLSHMHEYRHSCTNTRAYLNSSGRHFGCFAICLYDCSRSSRTSYLLPPSPLPTTNRWVNTPYSPPPPPLPLPLPLPLSSPLAVVKRRIFIHANFAFYFLTSTFIWSAPEAPSWVWVRVCVCACAWLCVCQDEEWYAAMLDDKWRAILNDLYCPLPCPPQAIGSLCPFLSPALLLSLSLSLARFSSFDRS